MADALTSGLHTVPRGMATGRAWDGPRGLLVARRNARCRLVSVDPVPFSSCFSACGQLQPVETERVYGSFGVCRRNRGDSLLRNVLPVPTQRYEAAAQAGRERQPNRPVPARLRGAS